MFCYIHCYVCGSRRRVPLMVSRDASGNLFIPLGSCRNCYPQTAEVAQAERAKGVHYYDTTRSYPYWRMLRPVTRTRRHHDA